MQTTANLTGTCNCKQYSFWNVPISNLRWHAKQIAAVPQNNRMNRLIIQARAGVNQNGATAGEGLKKERLASMSGIVTDDAVPEGHKGLHEFLYGDPNAHDDASYSVRRGEDDGESVLSVEAYLSTRDGEKPVGVYAVYDTRRALQYVGFSRNVVLSVKGHLARVGSDRCTYVRVMVFANKAMATRKALEEGATTWIDQAGTLPPGNGVERSVWEDRPPAVATMSPKEVAEYDEKKLKMMKAMGEDLGKAPEGEEDDAKTRRLKMIAAVEGDNWSAVIDGQTNLTKPSQNGAMPAAAPSEAQPAAAPEPIQSPFSRAAVHRSIGNPGTAEEAAPLEMNMASVDAALEEVRPYLIADGGNVEVVSVEAGSVFLRLNGACGTCPSSVATMKMGIERSLKATFGDQLLSVLQVDQIDTRASVAAVNEHLDMLRPAIKTYGGSVDVVSVENGTCKVAYQGPAPIGMGIQAAIKDKFPDIHTVKLDG